MYYIPPPAEGPQPGAQPATWEDARTCVAGLKAVGAAEAEILQKLREMGLGDEDALAVLDELEPHNTKKSRRRRNRKMSGAPEANQLNQLLQAQVQANKEAGRSNMLIGGAVFVIGLVVTLGTLAAAQGGGRYVIAYGAVIWGAAQFIRGMAQAGGSSS
jgi:hypothetical protein